MTIRHVAFAAIATLVLASVPLRAQEITAEDRTAIIAVIDTLTNAVKTADLGAMFDGIPPKLRAHMATKFGVSDADLRKAMSAQMGAALATVTFEDFRMALDQATSGATLHVARPYMLIPTTSVLAVEGVGKVIATSQTLAIKDDGHWYLLRVDDPSQVQMITEVYPDLASLTFTPSTMEAIE